MTDDIEDEVVECDALMAKANEMVEVCKFKYHLNNSFFRDHVTPELQHKAVDQPKQKKGGLSSDAQFRLFVIIFLAIAVIGYLIFGD